MCEGFGFLFYLIVRFSLTYFAQVFIRHSFCPYADSFKAQYN